MIVGEANDLFDIVSSQNIPQFSRYINRKCWTATLYEYGANLCNTTSTIDLGPDLKLLSTSLNAGKKDN